MKPVFFLWVSFLGVGILLTAIDIRLCRISRQVENSGIHQDAFQRIEDREGKIWYVKPSQVVSIEPEIDVVGDGRWTNGCFARLSTHGFPIRFAGDSDIAATALGLR